MAESDLTADLRHALANPLGALLAEAQLLLTGNAPLDGETRQALQQIEQLALRMRAILQQQTQADGPSPASAPVKENR
jgi:signal transduction histidine kinase